MSKRFIKSICSMSSATPIDSDCCRLLTASTAITLQPTFLSTSARFLKATSYRNKEKCAEVHIHSRAQGFSTPETRRRSSCPPPSPNLVLTYSPDKVSHGMLARAATPYQAFHDGATCLSRATSSRRVLNLSSEEVHQVNTILTQPTRRRVSTDRLNRVGSKMVLPLEGEFGSRPIGKIFPHLYPTPDISEGEGTMRRKKFILASFVWVRFRQFFEKDIIYKDIGQIGYTK